MAWASSIFRSPARSSAISVRRLTSNPHHPAGRRRPRRSIRPLWVAGRIRLSDSNPPLSASPSLVEARALTWKNLYISESGGRRSDRNRDHLPPPPHRPTHPHQRHRRHPSRGNSPGGTVTNGPGAAGSTPAHPRVGTEKPPAMGIPHRPGFIPLSGCTCGETSCQHGQRNCLGDGLFGTSHSQATASIR